MQGVQFIVGRMCANVYYGLRCRFYRYQLLSKSFFTMFPPNWFSFWDRQVPHLRGSHVAQRCGLVFVASFFRWQHTEPILRSRPRERSKFWTARVK